MSTQLSTITEVVPQLIATATLHIETAGPGLTEITNQAANFLSQIGGRDGVLQVFLRHTSASLTIQENADPDVQTHLISALDRLAPEDAPWVRGVEGPDDMPAHVKAMLNGVSLHVPVIRGKLASAHGRASIWSSTGAGRIAARWFCSTSAAANSAWQPIDAGRRRGAL